MKRFDQLFPALLIFAAASLLFAGALRAVPARAQGPRQPKVMDCVHFMLYLPEEFVGQERGGLIAFLREDDGTVDLNYFTGRQTIRGIPEPDNPPDFIEHKIRVPYDNAGRAPRTFHYCEEH